MKTYSKKLTRIRRASSGVERTRHNQGIHNELAPALARFRQPVMPRVRSMNDGRNVLPVIARSYGILVKMYFKEHGRPHFHAIYGEYNSVFDIETLETIEGDLPRRAERMVRE